MIFEEGNVCCLSRQLELGLDNFGKARRSERISRRDMKGTAEGEEETILQREKGEIWFTCKPMSGRGEEGITLSTTTTTTTTIR